MKHASGFEIVSLKELYETFSQPFAPDTEGEGSYSILRPRKPSGIPAPFINYKHDEFAPVPGFEYSEIAVAFIPDAIVSQTGVVIVKDKFIIAETVEANLESNFPQGFSRDSILAGCATSDDIVINSGKLGMWNYSLFLLEVSPIFYLSSLIPSLHAFKHSIFFSNYVTQATIADRLSVIETLGVDSSRIVKQESPFCRYKGVVVFKINDPHRSQRLSQAISPVATALKDRFVSSVTTTPKRLYISRQSASSRKVSNFDELKSEALDKYDITPVTLEHMSLAQQIDMFSKADFVIAEHGAGLANAAFMRPGAFVLEFMPKGIANRAVYRYLSYHSKLNYCCASIPVPEGWRWHKDDVEAPVSIYKFLLDRI